MRFTLGALVDRVSGMFVPLGASHTGLQLIVVGLQFPEFLLMKDIVKLFVLHVDVHARCCIHAGYCWFDGDVIHPRCAR